MNRGVFVNIEGPDGVGKDVNICNIAKWLEKLGKKFIVVKDPSPEVAQEIRELLLTNSSLENSTRLYLYLAARSELIHKQILPALNEGKIVISNRFTLSTYCYQGEFFSKEQIDMAMCAGGLNIVKPDLQIAYLTKKSFRELQDEDVMGVYCNNYRTQILNRYSEFSKEPDLNIKVIWSDGKTVDQVFEETKVLLQSVIE
jgi:dTMP kinase